MIDSFSFTNMADLWAFLSQMSSANTSSLSIGRNQESACHFTAKFHRSSRPPHAFRWGTCAACLNLPVGLVEAYLRAVMALLTLRRIPSISTPPVSSVNPMMLFFFCTHKWVCRAWAQHSIIANVIMEYNICFPFLLKGAILIGSGKTLHATVVADLFHFSERFSSWQCFYFTTISASGYGNACFICVCFCS